MQIYIVPRTAGDYPRAIGEGLHTPDSVHDGLYPLSTAISDYDDLLEMLDREIDFYNSPGYADADARYFDVDDLYLGQQPGDGYDYPCGVDDDDDLYTRGPVHTDVEQGAPQPWEHFDLAAFEEEITNAQYFDVLERRTPADVPVPSDGEDETDSDFEIDDELGPHSTVRDGASPGSDKALRRQLEEGGGVDLYHGLVFRHLSYSGFDGFEEENLDVLLSAEDAWMSDHLY
ncbi:hypothetical protein HYPSUDRAFT_57977 [Hypholoma sublateritium FD-334 SS-4]|uniref:Uncharacterized protein n=1 Tax=Hypholoma sublateritium (strain FD-334 SS-4) TaxID=945553 RepID=A0A0D2NCR4_HYPSF|nr:hypothetical protein HYPSUDRAFT_57977 [Hypholoma sublateritium FD-334 SS-4]